MLRRYNRWAVKQCTRAQCSPLLLIPLLILALAVLVYVYREAILQTLEVIALVLVTAIAVSTASVIAWFGSRGFIRYRRAHAVALPGPVPTKAKVRKGDPAVVGEPGTFAETADWLADDNTVLAWSSDGTTLLGGQAPAEHHK